MYVYMEQLITKYSAFIYNGIHKKYSISHKSRYLQILNCLIIVCSYYSNLQLKA